MKRIWTWLRDARGRFVRRIRMASTNLRVALAGGAAVVVVAAGTVAVRSTDPCWCAQSIVSSSNRAALSEASVLGGAKDGEVVLYVACGEGDATADAPLPDTIVLGPCGTRGLASTGVGLAGATADALRSTGRWSGSVGVAFRCGPDPDRPGMLNSDTNESCCCPAPKTPACSAVAYSCPP